MSHASAARARTPRRWDCEERREDVEEGESKGSCLEEAEVRPWSQVEVWAWVVFPEVARRRVEEGSWQRVGARELSWGCLWFVLA